MNTLILNADFLPHRIVHWRTAFLMTWGDEASAKTIATFDKVVKDSGGRHYNIPAVVILDKYVKNNNKPSLYSKKTVLLRDSFTCQYCGRKFQPKNLTIDHVVPKSKKEKLPKGIHVNSFENCVASCLRCNASKADRTPAEAKMHLLKTPRGLTRGQKLILDVKSKEIPQEWLPYIESL